MDGPVDHIERPALPWQIERLSECGRVLDECRTVLTREEWDAKERRLGKQRAAMDTCMTCISRAHYSPKTWEEDPAAVMSRHCDRGGYRLGVEKPITLELRAIALLIAAHRDEFDEAITGMQQTVSLPDVRLRRRVRTGFNGRPL